MRGGEGEGGEGGVGVRANTQACRNAIAVHSVCACVHTARGRGGGGGGGQDQAARAKSSASMRCTCVPARGSGRRRRDLRGERTETAMRPGVGTRVRQNKPGDATHAHGTSITDPKPCHRPPTYTAPHPSRRTRHHTTTHAHASVGAYIRTPPCSPVPSSSCMMNRGSMSHA